MKWFDRIEQREVNGFFKLFAIDDLEGKDYLLSDKGIDNVSSIDTGYRVAVDSINKRDPFENEKSMSDFCENFMKQLQEIDVKNYKKKYSINV